jgi:hypothetical protein
MSDIDDTVWHRYRIAFPDDGLPMMYWEQDSEAQLERLMERAIEADRPLTPDDLLKAQGLDPVQPGDVV